MVEPLKNKKVTQDNFVIGEIDILYYDKDIKSAVEWLREELSRGISLNQKGNEMMLMISKKIDEAFEDVV